MIRRAPRAPRAQVRERLQLLEMDQSAARAEQRTLATTESVLQVERDVAQQLHRQLERIAAFETDRLGAAVSRMHGLQVGPPPLPESSGPAGWVGLGEAGHVRGQSVWGNPPSKSKQF